MIAILLFSHRQIPMAAFSDLRTDLEMTFSSPPDQIEAWTEPTDDLIVTHSEQFTDLLHNLSNKILDNVRLWNNVSAVSSLQNGQPVMLRGRVGSYILLKYYAENDYDFHPYRISISGVLMCTIPELNRIALRADLGTFGNKTDKILRILDWLSARNQIHLDELPLISTPEVINGIITSTKKHILEETSKRELKSSVRRLFSKYLDQFTIRMNYGYYLLSRGKLLSGPDFIDDHILKKGLTNGQEVFVTMMNSGNIRDEYSFMATPDFWTFYYSVIGMLDLLKEIYGISDGTVGRSIIVLYQNGVLDRDITICGALTDSISFTAPRIIPNLSAISRPRGIITDARLIETGLSKMEVDELYREVEMSIYSRMDGTPNRMMTGLLGQVSLMRLDLNELVHDGVERDDSSLAASSSGISTDIRFELLAQRMKGVKNSGRVTARKIGDLRLFDYSNITIPSMDNRLMNMPLAKIRDALSNIGIRTRIKDKTLLCNILDVTCNTRKDLIHKLDVDNMVSFQAASNDIYHDNEIFSDRSLLELAVEVKSSYRTGNAPPIRDINEVDEGISFQSAYEQANREGTVHTVLNIDEEKRDEIQRELSSLAQYPCNLEFDQYARCRELPHTDMTVLAIMVTRRNDNYMLWDRQDLLFLITRGYSDPHSEAYFTDELMDRFHLLITLSSIKLLILAQLYDVKLDSDLLLNLANSPINPIERYILEDRISELATMVGILPENVQELSDDELWISVYRTISLTYRGSIKLIPLSRNNARSLTDSNMSWFTEQELHQNIGIVNPIETQLHTRGFFRISNRNLSGNQTTLMGVMDDFDDPSLQLVGYGYLDKFITFSLEDLTCAFTRKDDDEFYNPCYNARYTEGADYEPFNQIRTFTVPEVKQLRRILTTMVSRMQSMEHPPVSMIEEIDHLLLIIEQRMANMYQANEEVKEILRSIDNLNQGDGEQLRDWLENVYYLAWYYRRWNGPSTPFPVHSNQTEDSSNKPQADGTRACKGVDKHTSNIVEIEGKMNKHLRTFIGTLRELNLDKGNYTRRSGKLKTLLDRATSGRTCIRTSSRLLLITSYGYLNMAYHYRERGVDFNKMHSIS